MGAVPKKKFVEYENRGRRGNWVDITEFNMRKWVRRTYIWPRYLSEVGRKSKKGKKPGRKKRDTYIGYYHGGGAEEKNCGV